MNQRASAQMLFGGCFLCMYFHICMAARKIERTTSLNSESGLSHDVDRWITKMFKLEDDTPSTARSLKPPLPLCFSGREDLGKVLKGGIQVGAPPKGDPFPAAELRHFPYASHSHCNEMTQPLQFKADDCELPAFDPETFVHLIRGHRLVFWGDSVTRQFFFYVTLRLERYQIHESYDGPGKSSKLPLADPKVCTLKTPGDDGLSLGTECFELQHKDLVESKACFHYLDEDTAICYIRAEDEVVDDRNVVYWNGLKPTDIVFANTGLHHNSRVKFRSCHKSFTSLIKYQLKRRPLPLILWRDTSAQHFEGGEGGNYPPSRSSYLRHIVPGEFKCSSHSFEEMRGNDWRNMLLNTEGFMTDGFKMDLPIMRVWNITSMSSELHPVTLETSRTEEGHAIADCTHFCPSYGGMYEIWSTVLHNILRAAQPLSETLKIKYHAVDLEYGNEIRRAKAEEAKERLFWLPNSTMAETSEDSSAETA